MLQTPPLSLYIHLPWCIAKCPYCDFNSHTVRGTIPEMPYIEALVRDVENALPRVWGRTVRSVFIGGGTPTLFSPRALDTLLSQLRARLPFAHEIEMTLEANPGTVDNAKLAEYRSLGINRLSLGVQSFQDSLLREIGRIHDGQQAKAAVRGAQLAGFSNFNIDLMFGLPSQTPAEGLRDVQTAVDSGASHISYYQLTIERNTPFFRQPPALPHEDVICNIQQQALELLSASDYEHYEISAFAHPGRRCQHNMNYWLFGDYLGIGAGAHSKLTDISGPTIVREWKIKHPDRYMAALDSDAFVAGRQELDQADLIAEYMLNALRLSEGFSIDQFEANTGVAETEIAARLAHAEACSLLVGKPKIRATPLGFQYLNELLQVFLPDSGESGAAACR